MGGAASTKRGDQVQDERSRPPIGQSVDDSCPCHSLDTTVILAALVEAGEGFEKAQVIAEDIHKYLQANGRPPCANDELLIQLGLEDSSVRARLLARVQAIMAGLEGASTPLEKKPQQQQQQQGRLTPPAKPPRVNSNNILSTTSSSSSAAAAAERIMIQQRFSSSSSSSSGRPYSDDFESEDDKKDSRRSRVIIPEREKIHVQIGPSHVSIYESGSSPSSDTRNSPATATLSSPFIKVDSKLSTPASSPHHHHHHHHHPDQEKEEGPLPTNARSSSSPGPSTSRQPSLSPTSVSQGGIRRSSHSASAASRKTAETLKLRLNIPEQGGGGEGESATLGTQGSRKSISVALTGRRIRPNHWKLGNRIGKGSFGQVYVGLDEDTGQLIAIKAMPIGSNPADAQTLFQEIELMRRLEHPNIVRYLGAQVDTSGGKVYIFQEWMPGGSVSCLLDRFGPLRPAIVKKYTRQALEGLDYLHHNSIIHRDIKGGNLLVDEKGCVKVADFGASKQLGMDGSAEFNGQTMKGTPYFMSPEVLMGDHTSRKSDVWAVGGTVLQMLTGDPPWKSLNFQSAMGLMYHISHAETPPPMPEWIERNVLLHKFLLRCFERDVQKRPGAKELLLDAWIAGDDEETDGEEEEEDGAELGSRQGSHTSSAERDRESLESHRSDVALWGVQRADSGGMGSVGMKESEETFEFLARAISSREAHGDFDDDKEEEGGTHEHYLSSLGSNGGRTTDNMSHLPSVPSASDKGGQPKSARGGTALTTTGSASVAALNPNIAIARNSSQDSFSPSHLYESQDQPAELRSRPSASLLALAHQPVAKDGQPVLTRKRSKTRSEDMGYVGQGLHEQLQQEEENKSGHIRHISETRASVSTLRKISFPPHGGAAHAITSPPTTGGNDSAFVVRAGSGRNMIGAVDHYDMEHLPPVTSPKSHNNHHPIMRNSTSSGSSICDQDSPPSTSYDQRSSSKEIEIGPTAPLASPRTARRSSVEGLPVYAPGQGGINAGRAGAKLVHTQNTRLKQGDTGYKPYALDSTRENGQHSSTTAPSKDDDEERKTRNDVLGGGPSRSPSSQQQKEVRSKSYSGRSHSPFASNDRDAGRRASREADLLPLMASPYRRGSDGVVHKALPTSPKDHNTPSSMEDYTPSSEEGGGGGGGKGRSGSFQIHRVVNTLDMNGTIMAVGEQPAAPSLVRDIMSPPPHNGIAATSGMKERKSSVKGECLDEHSTGQLLGPGKIAAEGIERVGSSRAIATEDEASWRCARPSCCKNNVASSDHCLECATIRGSSGVRSEQASVYTRSPASGVSNSPATTPSSSTSNMPRLSRKEAVTTPKTGGTPLYRIKKV